MGAGVKRRRIGRRIDRPERDEAAGQRLALRAVEARQGRNGFADRKRRVTFGHLEILCRKSERVQPP